MIDHGSTRNDDWAAHGICTYRDPALWDGVPVNESPYASLDFSKAKAICFQCPVRRLCVRNAVESGDTGCMRGGRTPDQLQRMVRLLRVLRPRRSTSRLYAVVPSRTGPSVTVL